MNATPKLRGADVVLPPMLTSWGAWMLLVDPIGHSASFTRFEALPHHVWGAGVILVGVSALLLAGYGGRCVRHRCQMLTLAGSAILTGAGWIFIWTMLVLGNWTSTGTVTYAWLTLLSVANFLEYTGLRINANNG